MDPSFVSSIKEAVLKSGENLRNYYGNIDIHNTKSDKAHDVVTRLDIETEIFLAREFEKIDRTIGFHGEEFGMRKNSDTFFLVDPIDGTAFFVRGIPFCTTMVALIKEGEVIFSLINNFALDELYEAEKGRGAFLNGEKISVSNRILQDAYLSLESNVSKEENMKKYVSLRKKCVVMNTINCGYEMSLVARGKIEGRISLDPFGKDWDYAAGALLVKEAGGIVKNINSDSYDYKNHNFLAVNKEVYKELTEGNTSLFPVE